MNASTQVTLECHAGPQTEGGTRPRLSVVVPTRNSEPTLGRCLESIRAQVDASGRPFPCELIVVDNNSSDRTLVIAETHADIVETWGPERSAQRNRGAARANAPYVLFIDSDMVLDPSVCAEVATDLDRGAGAVIVPEESFGVGYFARCRALEKKITTGDPRTEAARGFPIQLLRQVGWNESLTGPEDWELTERINATGARTGRTEAIIHHDEGRLRLRGTFTKKTYYGRGVGKYLAGSASSASRPSASMAQRARRLSPLRLLRKPGLLIRRPDLAAGMMTLKVVEAAGIATGIVAAARAARRPGRTAHDGPVR